MPNYRLYQDGETSFTIQSPDNSTTAVFSVKSSNNHHHQYQVSTLDLRKKGSPKQDILYKGPGKQEAITIAYLLARQFASGIDPDFEDKTGMKQSKLEQIAQTPLLSLPISDKYFSTSHGAVIIPGQYPISEDRDPNTPADMP